MFAEAAKKYSSALANSDKVKINQKVGTNGIFKAVNAMGALPTRKPGLLNENLSGETMYETIMGAVKGNRSFLHERLQSKAVIFILILKVKRSVLPCSMNVVLLGSTWQ